VFGGQNKGTDGAMLTANELVFTLYGSYVSANFGENLSRNATVTVNTDKYTDIMTDANHYVIYRRACYFCHQIVCGGALLYIIALICFIRDQQGQNMVCTS